MHTPKPWTCAACGETHDTLPAVAFQGPDCWASASEAEREAEFTKTSDTCVWYDGAHTNYFVRCVYEIPIIGRTDVLSFGLWSSLSENNFDAYLDVWDDPTRSHLSGMFSYLGNSVPGYPETINMICDVIPRDNGFRPILVFEDEEHPLVAQQRTGVTMDYAASYIHDHLEL